MSTEKPLEILKSALLLELRGKAFYEQAAANAKDSDVKAFFGELAEDEASHIQMLSDQYRGYQNGGAFTAFERGPQDESVAAVVLSDKLKTRIAGAGFESAAISAAMGMEERAVSLYSQRAAEASDPEEKALYDWLAKWETRHLESLAKIEKAVTEAIWNDNNFWPF